ncbi:recombinase family protein [Acidobacteria bacterium AH-259-G07]|nr:recombinase family protein [Acidobacteria bacterium AH-259-G07]
MNEEKNNKFLAYIRVSSKDQTRGVSLEEQKSQIEKYAERNGYVIENFYKEVESASKTGRHLFEEVVKEIKDKNLRGIIFHKVDRSARNPKDQAVLYELMNEGYVFHFVSESLSTDTHLGKNMMYLLWGMASAYTENLKFEVNKGMMGRIKQGKFPLPGPLGYLDKKEAEKLGFQPELCVKTIDPVRGPLIKKAFRLYATGEYSVKAVNKILHDIGLRNKGGNPFHWKLLYGVLRNPFYYGHMQYKGLLYPGIHKPLIKKSLFDTVQVVVEGKANKVKRTYQYEFQGSVQCASCKRLMRSLTAKKKYQYFYCRRRDCAFKNILRQDKVGQFYIKNLKELSFKNNEVEEFQAALEMLREEILPSKEEEIKRIDFELVKSEERLERLVDKDLDGEVPQEIYKKKKNQLLATIATLKEKRANLEDPNSRIFAKFDELGKLLENPVLLYEQRPFEQKRKLMKSTVANFTWNGKKLDIHWKIPLNLIAERQKLTNGGANREQWKTLLIKIYRFFSKNAHLSRLAHHIEHEAA